MTFVLWALFWVWFPPKPEATCSVAVVLLPLPGSRAQRTVWYVLTANALLQMTFLGVFSYLAANLIQTYGMTVGETLLPLTLAGLGVISGGLISGRIADSRRRLSLLTLAASLGRLLAVLVFVGTVSPWLTMAFAFGVTASLRVSSFIMCAGRGPLKIAQGRSYAQSRGRNGAQPASSTQSQPIQRGSPGPWPLYRAEPRRPLAMAWAFEAG